MADDLDEKNKQVKDDFMDEITKIVKKNVSNPFMGLIRKSDPEILRSCRFFVAFPCFVLDFPIQSLRKSRPWSNFTGFFPYSWGVL